MAPWEEEPATMMQNIVTLKMQKDIFEKMESEVIISEDNSYVCFHG